MKQGSWFRSQELQLAGAFRLREVKFSIWDVGLLRARD